ncbi:MAG TPA: MerR family transcriptional regulator [Acidimicrobiales bacterium]|nr:MerR family transcriptional regulator [Acidimicrobiales bacterium]
MAERLHLTIGEVLSLLQQEFPDVSISKIRFLESQGLVDPERTPSGYRKFYDHDVERLRWILRQQREHFLPLKVIRGRLEGEDGDPTGAHLPGDPVPAAAIAPTSAAAGPAAQSAPAPAPAPAQGPVAGPAPEGPAPQSEAERPGAPAHPAPAPAAQPATRSPEPAAPESSAAPSAEAEPAAEPAPAEPAPPETPPTEHQPARNGAAPAAEADAPRPAAGRRTPEPEPAEGERAATAAPARAGTRRRESSGSHPDVYTVGELAHQVGCDAKLINDLVQYGILSAGINVGGVPYFEPSAVELARIGARFAELGVEPRHLRPWRNAADREAGLFEQLVMPLLRQRNPQARSQAAERLDELTKLGGELRAGLVSEAVRQIR